MSSYADDIVLDLELTGDRGNSRSLSWSSSQASEIEPGAVTVRPPKQAGEDSGDPVHLWPVSYIVESVNDEFDASGISGPGTVHLSNEDTYVESVRFSPAAANAPATTPDGPTQTWPRWLLSIHGPTPARAARSSGSSPSTAPWSVRNELRRGANLGVDLLEL